ncbi:pentapeptide repeat-containing protein [Nocardia sp. NPDC052112]|uniref:pentapeptide repeat-containing protein n=1 Tax=Nocardia sp. NPDC052112 TaxID=3155646 RepID=UPI0034345812
MGQPKEYTYSVHAWPIDRAACTALEDYIRTRTTAQDGVHGALGGAGLNFTRADLRDFDLSDAYLAVADLDGVNLAGADLDRATLLGARLRNADLSGTHLHKVEADGCVGEGLNLSGANLFRASFVKADLRRADLSNCELSSTNLREADLRAANLRGCHFGPTPTRLTRAQLSGAHVTDAWGEVRGPIRVDDDQILTGEQLAEWFASRGAPRVHLVE